MTEQMPRWDLSDLYPSMDSPELKKDMASVSAGALRFETHYKGKLAESTPDEFGKSIEEYERLNETLGRLDAYSYMMHSTNMNDPEISTFYQNVCEKSNDVSGKMLFFELELNGLTDEQLAEKMTSETAKKYEPWLKNVRAGRDHMLPENMEKLLHDKSMSSATAWNRLFDETMASLRFNVGGKELTEPEAMAKMSDPDMATRHEACAEINRVMKDNMSTFALITNTLAKDKQIEDEWRGYKRPISARNIENQVEDEVVDALVDSVVDSHADISHRYYKLKADWLGVDKLDYSDRNAPIPDLPEKKYSWDDAKNIVLSAYNEFSPEMAAIGKKFFDNNWIDVAPKEGKEGGAYAHPTVPSAHPYLMLNFMGTAGDVMTLAHELGHGVHQYLAREQGYLKSNTPITLAETASIFGEMMTFKYMLKHEKDPKQRFAMLAEKTGSMINSSVRQIAFHRFETEVHTARRKEGELSPDRLNGIWTKTQNDALGPSVTNDDKSNAMWSTIPHLIHTPFYVYGYAFGDCLVNSLYKVHEDGKVADFPKKYMDMLAKGGSERHQQMLKPFGLDASKPDFWKKGLSVVKGFVDELEVLTDQLGMNKNKNNGHQTGKTTTVAPPVQTAIAHRAATGR